MSARRPLGALADILGMRFVDAGPGKCSFECALTPEHMNPYGVVHGGIVYTLVDYAMGGALVTRLAPGERCATLEIKINYLATASSGKIRADATLIDRTTRIAVLEARVVADDGRLISVATGTFYIQSAPSQ